MAGLKPTARQQALPVHPNDGTAASAEFRLPSARALMEKARALLSQSGPDCQADADRLTDLLFRLDSGRFHLAVLGQFKRGKSTLLNALLGEAVLPVSVVPLTAIPTFIHAADALESRVIFQDGRAPETCEGDLAGFLRRYVTEQGNPKNRLAVSQVEIGHPAPILREGVTLVDTPGIGSTFRHNTEATLNFLPQCDAALFLVSADPPITQVEVEFLREVRKRVPRLFFLLNKVDYLEGAEREEALRFLRSVLAEQAQMPPDAPIFCVSARDGLRARASDDARLWEKSGLAAVEGHLIGFLARDKAAALEAAASGRAVEVLRQCAMRAPGAPQSSTSAGGPGTPPGDIRAETGRDRVRTCRGQGPAGGQPETAARVSGDPLGRPPRRGPRVPGGDCPGSARKAGGGRRRGGRSEGAGGGDTRLLRA